jgi:Zn-dependent M28 family amino/carboxypeptidase
MRRLWLPMLLLTLLPAATTEEEILNRAQALSRDEFGGVIQFLAHDLLEGRAPGTRGGELAELYMESAFKLLGLRPAFGDSYRQPFTLRGFRLQTLQAQLAGSDLEYSRDLAGEALIDGDFSVSGDAVFCGFGIHAPDWNWDDFKGVDLRGKALIVRVNDPGHFDPARFAGRFLSYYGRWSYKIEEAAGRGAAAILMIHTDDTAGYGWPVVQNSWSGESLMLPEEVKRGPLFRGWVREAALRKVLSRHGLDLDKLYRHSLDPRFRPQPLGMRLTISGRSAARTLETANVAAEIPGKRPERIVLAAHIDHLGANPALDGDTIFNGAIDNGAAVAALLLTARLLKETQPPPPCTILFLACQAEEAGLLGSEYFAAHADPSSIRACINFESTPVWEKALSLTAVGARFSTLGDDVRAVAARLDLQWRAFSLDDQGFFYRSDQFPFARRSIPSVWLSAGEEFASGRNRIADFFHGDYHTVRDEFHPEWELESLRQTAAAAALLTWRVASGPAPRLIGRPTYPLAPRAGH